MKVTKDKNGVNVTGLTDDQALAVMSLVGNVNWPRVGGIYHNFCLIFPEYQTVWYKHYKNGNKADINLSSEQLKTHNAIVDEILASRIVRAKPVSTQRRDASGRFLKKVWVARFSYPSSQNSWHNVPRTVITNATGRTRPYYNVHSGGSIEGVDLTRGAFRRFNVDKIVGNVKWTREYADQVK